jgi:uncharacterized sulfatase
MACAFVGACSSPPPGEAWPSVAPKRAPNIVLIIGDDMNWDDGSLYGGQVPTPNIERLAREGMTFERAFQSTAMCAVTRHQLYTGLDPMRNGAYPQHSFASADITTIFGYLKALGYRVGITGKTHVGPSAIFPWETVGEATTDGGVGEGMPPIDFAKAETFMTRDAAQPFFLVFASHNPHSPWTEGDRSKFDAGKITVPPYLVDTPLLRERLVAYFAEIGALDDEVGRVLDMLDRHGLANDTLVLFTSEQGNSVPFSKWTLYDAGLRTEMVVRWPGRIAPGSRTGAMVSYADVTPTFIAAAGATPPATLDGRSFLPVLQGGATEARKYVYGIHTNFGIIGGEPYPMRSVRNDRYKLIRNLAPDQDFKNVLNNTAQGRVVIDDWTRAAAAGDEWARQRVAAYNRRPEFELYDIEADPFELRNLADDPALADVRRELVAELDRWMRQQGDTGMAAEMTAFTRINPAVVEWINRNYPDAARNPDGTRKTQ